MSLHQPWAMLAAAQQTSGVASPHDCVGWRCCSENVSLCRCRWEPGKHHGSVPAVSPITHTSMWIVVCECVSLEVPVVVPCESAGAVGAGDDDVILSLRWISVSPPPCPLSAVDVGTDMLELDCHLTKDEQVVVSHDANLQRCTGMDRPVSELTYSVSPCSWNPHRRGTQSQGRRRRRSLKGRSGFYVSRIGPARWWETKPPNQDWS